VDIVPQVTTIREWNPRRRVADTERGKEMRCTISMLERLIEAYRNNELRQGTKR
jgi:fructose-1,6-bisphosphatase-3